MQYVKQITCTYYSVIRVIYFIYLFIFDPRRKRYTVFAIFTCTVRFIHLYVFFVAPFGKHINETLL